MTFSFDPEARAEFVEAVNFYDDREPGLGDDFEREVFATIERIVKHPNAWPRYSYRSRRCLCNRFPYSIVCRQTESDIVIYALMHQKRKPGYWKDRVKQLRTPPSEAYCAAATPEP